MMRGRLLTILFCICLAGLPAAFLIAQKRTFSEAENRYLAQPPAFSADDLLSGRWQDGLEDYASDQFPERARLMALSTVLQKAAGRKDLGGAWLAADGSFPEVHTPEDLDEEAFLQNLDRIADFAESGLFAGKHTVLLVPDAACVMQDALPAFARPYDAEALAELAAGRLKGCSVPDLAAAFEEYAAPASGQTGETAGADCGMPDHPEISAPLLYFRTDHHWSRDGVLAAYGLLTDGAGRYSAEPQLFSSAFLGSTWSRTLDPSAGPEELYVFPVADGITVTADGKDIPLYDLSAAQKKDKYSVFFGGNYGLVTIARTGAGTGRSLFVIKDSFANALVPLLTADYDTITMLDLRYFGGSPAALAAQLQPDDLLVVYSMSNLAQATELVKLLLK